jgi:hypothetical protein
LTNPTKSIGVVHTKLGPAQLLHCSNHPRNLAVALWIYPILDWKEFSAEMSWSVSADSPIQLSPINDEAKGWRMLASMGLCSECILDAVRMNYAYENLVYIMQGVKKFGTDEVEHFGAFGGNLEVLETGNLHLIDSSEWELSFVGQIKSSIRAICPTCTFDYLQNKDSGRILLSQLLDLS